MDLLVHERGARLRAAVCHGREEDIFAALAGRESERRGGGGGGSVGGDGDGDDGDEQKDEEEQGDEDEAASALLLGTFITLCRRFGRPPAPATLSSTSSSSSSLLSSSSPFGLLEQRCDAWCDRVEQYAPRHHPAALLAGGVAAAVGAFRGARRFLDERSVAVERIVPPNSKNEDDDGDNGGGNGLCSVSLSPERTRIAPCAAKPSRANERRGAL